MWAARLFPEGSDRYVRGKEFFRKMDGWKTLKPKQWMSFWIMYGAGVAVHNGSVDRYFFWDFSHWIQPTVITIILTVLVAMLFKKTQALDIGQLQAQPFTGAGIYLAIGILLFLIGWGGNPLTGLVAGSAYFLALLSAYAVFMVPLEEKENEKWIITDQGKRVRWSGIAVLLALAACGIGLYTDDPVISTASAVWLPFPLVAFIAPHARHIRRCRVYVIFIYGFFVAMRAPWLLVFMLAHYHGLRKYNYFRFGKIDPTLIIEVPKDEY